MLQPQEREGRQEVKLQSQKQLEKRIAQGTWGNALSMPGSQIRGLLLLEERKYIQNVHWWGLDSPSPAKHSDDPLIKVARCHVMAGWASRETRSVHRGRRNILPAGSFPMVCPSHWEPEEKPKDARVQEWLLLQAVTYSQITHKDLHLGKVSQGDSSRTHRNLWAQTPQSWRCAGRSHITHTCSRPALG